MQHYVTYALEIKCLNQSNVISLSTTTRNIMQQNENKI